MTALYGARDELNPLLTWFRFTETSAGLREIGISASVLYMYAQIIKAERMNDPMNILETFNRAQHLFVLLSGTM